MSIYCFHEAIYSDRIEFSGSWCPWWEGYWTLQLPVERRVSHRHEWLLERRKCTITKLKRLEIPQYSRKSWKRNYFQTTLSVSFSSRSWCLYWPIVKQRTRGCIQQLSQTTNRLLPLELSKPITDKSPSRFAPVSDSCLLTYLFICSMFLLSHLETTQRTTTHFPNNYTKKNCP